MALTPLQRRVLRVIAKNRSPDSRVAGGAPLARLSGRTSDDIDIFHDAAEAVLRAAEIDADALKAAGFGIELTNRGRSVVDGVVGRSSGESTRIQWSQDSAVRFFPAVKDRLFGYRLHDLDLAVNKVLAMAGRREPRDYYDLIRLHEAGMRLAILAWAAPAKDAGFTPELILDEVNRNSNYREGELKAEFADADPRAMKKVLLAATREARDLFPSLPLAQVGHLYLDRKGRAVLPDPQGVREGRLTLHGAVVRGAWPELPEERRIKRWGAPSRPRRKGPGDRRGRLRRGGRRLCR